MEGIEESERLMSRGGIEREREREREKRKGIVIRKRMERN